MSSPKPANSSARALIDRLAALLKERGASVRRGPRRNPLGADLQVDWNRRRFLVEVKTLRENRRAALHGAMAAAFLEARAAVSDSAVRPIPVVGVEVLTEQARAELADYLRRIAPDSDWGVLDRHGNRFFVGEPWAELNAQAPRQKRARRTPNLDVFSDRGQWLSKVLLAGHLPAELLAAPRGPIANARELARRAGVSTASVSRWASALEAGGFLERDGRVLHLVRREEYLARWRKATGKPAREVRARFLLPAGKPLDHLARVVAERVGSGAPSASIPGAIAWSSKPRTCLGLFSACAALGLGIVERAPLHLLLESISDATLRELELTAVARGEPFDVTVIEPRFPESTFRGAVMARGPLPLPAPASDVLQAWLDLADHPARGREQAEELERRFPSLLAGAPESE